MFEVDREEALDICRTLRNEFESRNPNITEIVYSSKELIFLSELPNKTSFTRAEKQLLRTVGMMFQADYFMTDLKHQNVDYGAMRAHVDLLERALIDGLENRNIAYIDMDVLFNDILKEYHVEYDDTNCSDQLAGVFINWNAVSELYNSYSSYMVSYKSFDVHSIEQLASANEGYKDYLSKSEEEKMIFSMNGIAAAFAAPVEYEFKKVVACILGRDDRRTFFDAINLFQEKKSYEIPALDVLVRKEYIDELHFIRKIHNDIDHGNRTILEDEMEKLYAIVSQGSLCQLLSDAFFDLTHD